MRQDNIDIRHLEDFIIKSYKTDIINCEPKTERDLLSAYQSYTVPLYKYICCLYTFAFPISNEIRAMLGHLSEYRSSGVINRRELHNVYGHFRRANLDALKIICDELDRSLLIILQKQYVYDYRNVYANYLKEFGRMYFDAKASYLEAQEKESVGSDRNTHNIFEFYYLASKKYILLKHFYEEHKKEIRKIEVLTVVKKGICWCCSIFGIIVTVLDLFI